MNDLTEAMKRKITQLEERIEQLEEINTTVLTEVLQHLKENQKNQIRELNVPMAPTGKDPTFH